jgi:hypothetical protein
MKDWFSAYWWLSAILLLPVAGIGAGCTAVAIGAAGAAGGTGVAYMMGDLEATMDASTQVVAAASKRALEELEIRVISAESSKLDAMVVGRTATDRRVRITTEREGEGISKVSIRVGTFGDEEMSRQILDALKKQLD